MTHITVERAKELLDYNPDSGVFRWRSDAIRGHTGTRYRAGKIAGHKDPNGYWRISIDGHLVKAHRLAWLILHGAWPKRMIDHIDGDTLNNRAANLREATPTENTRNRGVFRNNTSGFKGVYWCPKRAMWRARIGANNTRHNIGFFNTREEAAEAYRQACERLHGDFANTGRAA